ncbi:MAG TPA: LPXTG cell wall anchor domain-containing protein [Gemmatimonadaceae bacterium]
MSDETQHEADTPPAGDRHGVTFVILGAVLVALGAFFVRRVL